MIDCSICSRQLTDPESIAKGAGHTCLSRNHDRRMKTKFFASDAKFLKERAKHGVESKIDGFKSKTLIKVGEKVHLVKSDVGNAPRVSMNDDRDFDIDTYMPSHEETENEFTCNVIADFLGLNIPKYGIGQHQAIGKTTL